MNEQAIRDSYELFKTGGYSKSYEEFVTLINSNPQALEDSYTLFQTGGYTKGMEEYELLMGVKKKDEPMESTSEDGSLDSSEEAPEALFPSPEQQAVKDEEILQAIQQGVVNDDAGPFEREANQAALTDGRGQQWDGVPFNEQEARIKKEMREVEDASIVERDLMKQEAEALELDKERAMVLSTPEVDRQLSEVNSQLVGLKEEEVVEKLQDLFKGRGFTFQTIGKGFSRMRVRTTDGLHSIDISLNNYRTSSDVAESAELQTFLRTHFNPTPFNENQDSITKAVRAQEMRDSERWNEDGTRSTVKFMSYEEDGVHKVAPTLFPKSTVQRSSPREEDWVELGMDEAITEAERRNEVFTFDSQEEAEAFAEGSWKGVNSVDLEGQKYYNQYGRDYISDSQAFDNYSKAKETRLFLEEELAIQQSSFFGDEGQYDGLSPDEQEAYGEYFRKDGSLRGDAQDIINALDKEEANLWNIIDSENYMEVQDNFDAYLEKQHQESAQQAANINYEAMAIEDGLNNVSLNEFGITLDQLSTYQPKDEAERVRLNEVIEIQNSLETKKELAALQYETALTYFDAKANKEIGVEFSNNLEGWWVAVSDGFANGQAGNVIMNAAMGIYGDEAEDMNRAAQKMTDYMNSVDGRQSRAMSRFNSAEEGFGREVRSALRRDPAEVIATWAGASLAQILPYGWKIIPSFIGAGAAAGATVGATGLVTGPGGVLTMGAGAVSGGMYGFRAGYAMTNLVLEYTNGVLDAGRELKYNMNDPEEAGLALQDPNVWERGRERGLKRGIPIALMDFLMTGLAGKVFKPIAVASKGRKLANYTAEALTLAPAFEGAGEFLAQLNVGDEVSMKEIIAEAGGSIGMSTPFSAVNIYKSTRGNYNQKIAENLMNTKLMASERASDKQIQSWGNRMLKLGKITPEQNQRILENIGLRKEAQEILNITGPSRLGINKKVQTRLMELLDIRAGLDATTNSRSIFSEELAAVNKEIAEIGRTNELSESPAENINFDFGKIGKRTTVPSYRIGNTMYSKTQFLSYIDKLSLRRANKLMKDSEVVNDEETSILLDEKLQPFAPEEATQTTEDAIQESSTTEVDVQEQSTDGAAVGKGVAVEEKTQEQVDAEKKERLESRNKDLFSDTQEAPGIPGRPAISDITTEGDVSTAIYTNESGEADVIISSTGSTNNFVGFFRVYENGKPTNKWTSKMEVDSGVGFSDMITKAQEALPPGHQWTESKSISKDGLRVWNNSSKKGYTASLDSEGNVITKEVALNKAKKGETTSKASDYNTEVFATKEDADAAVKEIQKIYPGIKAKSKRLGRTSFQVKIELPVLVSKKSQEQVDVSQEEVDVSQEEDGAIEIVDRGTKEDVKAFQEGTLDAKRKKSLLAGIAQRINDKRKLTKFQKEISEDNDFEIAELQGQIIEQEKIMLEARDLEESLGPDTSVKKSKPAKIEGNISINKEGKYTFTPEGKVRRNKVVVAARKAAKAIKKILPKTRILLHESNEEYLKAVGRAGRAEYLPTENVIHVNLSSATETTMAHEVFHAVFLNSVKTDARAAKAAEVMMLSIRKSLKDGSALAKKIDAFAAKYTGEQAQFQNEERLAELIGILASSKDYKQLSKPAKNVIIEFFKDLALRFGIELETGFGKTDESVIDLMNTIARKTREGREIEESDVEALNEILPKDLTPEEYIKRQTEGRQQKVISDVLDVNELEVVSKGGSSRIVYMHPDGKNVIKVAKNPKGLEQNLALGFGDVNMLGTFVPELEEQGLDYIIIENVPRNDVEVNKFLKPIKGYMPQDFTRETPELMDAMAELGLDDFRNYNLLWNDFTATRNWGMRENGEFVLVDEGALDDSIHFSSEVKAWSKEEWGEVLSRRRENKKKPAPRQQMDERSAAVVRKGRLYGMNMDSGYFPRTASVEQIRKAFGPMGFGVMRAKDGGFGRGGGVYLTLNGRKFTPPSYRGRRQQQEEVMPPSPEDSMVEVITRGRAEGYSEASIREVLKSRGHKVKDIKRVMAATVDSFSDVRVPFEFGNIVGGMPAGIRLFQQIQSEVDSFKAPTVKRTGVRMTPFVRAQRLSDLREANPTLSEISDAALLRRFPRRGVQAETVVTEKTPAEVREKALEILRDNSVFQEQSEQVQMELVIAMDRALGITANRSVSKEIAAVRSSIVQRNRKGRELQAIKRQLRNLIRTHIPTSKDYSQAAINRLVRATAAVTEDNYRVQVEKVLQVIEKQRENMRAKVLKKLLTDVTRGARKTTTDTKKNRAGSLDIQGQSFAEIFKKALTLAMASEKQQEKAMEEFRLLAEELETDEGIVALAKSASGETLTSKEERLVNIAVALDLVKNLPSMSLEEVENLANDYAVAASMSRQELSATRKRRALETDALRQKVTDSLRISNPEMFHEDGSFIKDANERRALLDDVRKYWVEGKGKGLSARLKGQVKAAKTYVEIYKWKSGPQMVKSMFDSLKHLGTFMNSVNDTLYEQVFNRLNRMDNNSLKGYFKQQDFLRSLGYDAVLEQLFDTEMYEVKGVRSTVSGKKRNESFSKDQLLRLYALSLNPIQNRKLEAMGFTRVKMIEIEEYLGKDVTGFADKVVAYLSNEYYEGVNDVYRDVNDVNLNYVENYFPTMTTQSDVNPKQLFEGDFNGIFNAESAPALRNRNDMTSDINLKGATFTSALESHVKTMEHYKAYASDTKKLNAIFNTNSVDGTLAMLGVKTMVKQSVNNAINPDSGKNALNSSGKIFNTLQTKFTSYALAFRLVQIGKQMTSFINAFENYTFRKSGKQNVLVDIMPFLMDYAAVMAQPRKYIKMATEMSPTFRYRLAQGVKGDLAGLESGSPTLTALENRQTRWAKFARGFKKTGAAPTIVGDIMGVMGYMANYRRNIKNGMSEEKAVEAFNEYNQTQQTRRPSERAILQQNSNFIIRGFTMFGSTPILYINNVMQASTNILRSWNKGGIKSINQKDVRRLALNLGAANAAFVAMSNLGLLLRGDDEERKEAMRQIRNAMLGLNLVYMTPFVGSAVKGVENYITGNRRPADMGVNPLTSLFNKFKKAAEDDKEMEAMLQVVIEIGIGAQLAPLQALIETAGNLDEAGIKEIYDIIGYSESYREKAAKEGASIKRTLLPKAQKEKDLKDKLKEKQENNSAFMRTKEREKEARKKKKDRELYGN
jgi:hypothetical protein